MEPVVGLEMVNKLYLLTPHGQREIQLYVGDITKLRQEEKVDVLFISAIPYNYVPSRGSVIGGLYHNLGLSVKEIASNHVYQDLRKSCYCWISKPLEDKYPFRQLVCFEKQKTVEQTTSVNLAVRDMFRALMPVFKNDSCSVITPLLATRVQGVERTHMLGYLLTAAINWMHVGLPLKVFKVVIYPRAYNDASIEECIEVFNKLKENTMKLEIKPPPKPVRDIFFIYDHFDKDLRKEVWEALKKVKEGLKILSVHQVKTHEDTWQQEIYEKMITSKRVVSLLTSSFITSEDCMDAHNVALCVNRICSRPLLAPFCMDHLDNLPHYMTMVQWLNCRPRDPIKINTACESLVKSLESRQTKRQLQRTEYDVFLSYSHRNLEAAKQLLNLLQESQKGIKIFFDYHELKTGESWQQKLFQSVSSSSCVVALISPDYMTSATCQDELSLAMAQHFAKEQKQQLIPVVIQETEKLNFSPFIEPVMAITDQTSCFEKIVQDIIRWLKEGDMGETFREVKEQIDFNDILLSYREQRFCENYHFKDGNLCYVTEEENTEKDSRNDILIRLSYIPSDQLYVSFVKEMLQWKQGDRFSFETYEPTKDSQPDIDLVFLSNTYMQSQKEIEDFNAILGKSRSNKDSSYTLYIASIEDLSPSHLYLNLVPAEVNLSDNFWGNIRPETPTGSEGEKADELRQFLSSGEETLLSEVEILGLRKVVCDVLSIVKGHRILSLQDSVGALVNIVDVFSKLHPDHKPVESRKTKEQSQSLKISQKHSHPQEIAPGSDIKDNKPDKYKHSNDNSKTCIIL